MSELTRRRRSAPAPALNPNSRQISGLAGRKTTLVSAPRRGGRGGGWGTAAAAAAARGANHRTPPGGAPLPGSPSPLSASLLPSRRGREGLTAMRMMRGVGPSAAEGVPADPARRQPHGGKGSGQSYRRGAYKVGGSSPPASAPGDFRKASLYPSPAPYVSTPPAPSAPSASSPSSMSSLAAAAAAWDSMNRKSYGKGAAFDSKRAAAAAAPSSYSPVAGDYVGRLSSVKKSYGRGAFKPAAAAAAVEAGTQTRKAAPPATRQPTHGSSSGKRTRAPTPTPKAPNRAAARRAGAAATKRSAKSSRPLSCAEWMTRRTKAPARSPSKPMSVSKWMTSRAKP